MGGPARVKTQAVPPDGGWGWVIVAASFMIHIFTDGVTYSFGIFTTKFLDYFKESAAATSWVASIMVGVTLCSGPVSSALVNKYGCRMVTILGGILASGSLFASMWAQNILTLYITAGLLTGLGFGLIYLPAIVSVTCYFERRRSLATGIAVCGSGLGTFLLAPFIGKMCNDYGWRTAMGIVAALMLNSILFGILFRPLKEEEVPEPIIEEEMKPIVPVTTIVPKLQEKKEKSDQSNGGVANGRPISVHGHDELFLSQGGLTVRNGGMNGDIARMALSQPMLPHLHSERRGSTGRHHSGVMFRKDVLYSGSLAHISQVSRSTQWIPVETKSERSHKLSITEVPEESGESNTTVVCGLIPCSEETADAFNEMMDFSLLKDPIFITYTVSNFLTSLGFNVPYVHLSDMVAPMDIDGSHLISIIGLSNTVGRIVLGYIADKTWVNRLYIYNWSLTICGVSTALSVLATTFPWLAFYAAVYGFTIGAYVGLTSVILVDLLGLDKLTNAFGLLLLFQGVASFIGPPITGWLKDMTNSYHPGFIFSGAMMAISGLMLFAVPSLQRCLAKRERNSVSSPSSTVVS